MRTSSYELDARRARQNIQLKSTVPFILRVLKSHQMCDPTSHMTDGMFQSWVLCRLTDVRSVMSFLSELERDAQTFKKRKSTATGACQKVVQARAKITADMSINDARAALSVVRRIHCSCHEDGCFTIKRS